MAAHIAQALGDGSAYGVDITYVEQEGQLLGSAHSLTQVAPYINGTFLLVLGDYYFVTSEVERLVTRAEKTGSSVMAVKREKDRQALCEACVVEAEDDGRIIHIHEKPRFPSTDIKGCGLYAFQPEIFNAVYKTPRTALRDEYEITLSIELFIQDGNVVFAEDIIEWDANLTRPTDVLRCNLAALDYLDRPYLIGRDTCVAAGSEIQKAVIGNSVTIAGQVMLHKAAVFDGSRIDVEGLYENVIITPTAIFPCTDSGDEPGKHITVQEMHANNRRRKT